MDQYLSKIVFLWNLNTKLAINNLGNSFFIEDILDYLDGLASWHVAILKEKLAILHLACRLELISGTYARLKVYQWLQTGNIKSFINSILKALGHLSIQKVVKTFWGQPLLRRYKEELFEYAAPYTDKQDWRYFDPKAKARTYTF